MSTSSLEHWETPAESSRKVEQLRRDVRAAWSAPPRLSIPDWADRHRVLAKGFGATSGPWSTAAVEIARGPMLAPTEPGVHTITVMCCTQLMKTEFLLNVFAYHAHTDPCPILILQPKDDAAEQFSKERLQPSISATPVLKALIPSSKTRDAEATLTYKAFPGGFVALAGAGSPDNLARRPIRILLADEVDKYPITREGDPIMLAEERTATFGLNWLSIRACSPTVEEESRIAAMYAQSDQRRASVACPHCGHRQFLDFFRHVHWQRRLDDKGEPVEHLHKTARIHCDACAASWSEGERLRALATIRWHQTRPFECCGARHVPLDAFDTAWRTDREDKALGGAVWRWWSDKVDGRYAVYRATCPTCGEFGIDNRHAGFQASKLYSPSQKDRPADIVEKYLQAKGTPDSELAWWNTQMGLPHKPNVGKAVAVTALLARCEVWPDEIPEGVAVLTVGVDVQDYRVELEVVGWGMNEESWSIDYHVIDGEFSEPGTQAQLDDYLQRIWRRSDGRGFEILTACIDSGGHHTQAVYSFCKARLGRRIWAIKGESARTGQRNPVWPTKRPSSRNKAAFRPVILGVNAAKDTIRQRLHLDKPGPGYMHFPTTRDVGYFEQLTAERSVVKTAPGGIRYRIWELPAGKANEAGDCRVYAYGALCGAMHMGLQLNRKAEQALRPPAPEEFVAPRPAAPSEVIRIGRPAVIPTDAGRSASRAAFVSRLA